MLGIDTSAWKRRKRKKRAIAAARGAWSEAESRAHDAYERTASVVRSAGDRTAATARDAWRQGSRRMASLRGRSSWPGSGWARSLRPRSRRSWRDWRSWTEGRALPSGSTGRVLLAAGATAGAFALFRAARIARLESWDGRVAVVTGGTRGLGLLIARELLDDGCSVVICARDRDELRRAEEELSGRGADVLALRCDVSEEGDVDEMVARTIERFGRIDVLVNNAGEIGVGPIEDATAEDFRRARRVILDGAIHCTLAALPHMLEQGRGNVINVSSIGARIPVPHLLPYDSAKFALTGFSEGLRAELARRGIRVTTVLPGLSMRPERVARAAVRAAKRGEAELVLPLYAKVLTRLHGIAPATASWAAACVARALPDPAGSGAGGVEGRHLERGRDPGSLRRLPVLGRIGARSGRGPNVGNGERAASAVAGGLLVAGGIGRGGALGGAAGVLGAALLARGATGRCGVYRAIGRDTAVRRSAVHARRSVVVRCEPREAYALWRDARRLPRFLRHVDGVVALADDRWRWSLEMPGHPPLALDTRLTRDEPGEELAWRSERGGDVRHRGLVRFEPASGDRGTRVEVELSFDGGSGATLERLRSVVTAQRLEEDLRRFKQLAEEPRLEAMPRAGALEHR